MNEYFKGLTVAETPEDISEPVEGRLYGTLNTKNPPLRQPDYAVEDNVITYGLNGQSVYPLKHLDKTVVLEVPAPAQIESTPLDVVQKIYDNYMNGIKTDLYYPYYAAYSSLISVFASRSITFTYAGGPGGCNFYSIEATRSESDSNVITAINITTKVLT